MDRIASPRRPLTQAGVALVSVLWIVALLSILAGIVAARTRDETWMTRNQLDVARARYAAEAGFSLAVLELMDSLSRRTPPPAGVRRHEQDGLQVLTRTTSEAGRIDLNRAEPRLLAMLFESADPTTPGAPRVDAVLDWRDQDSTRRPAGAEDAEYRAGGKAYESRDDGFRAADELALVMGIPAALAYRIEPMLTVYSGSDGVNPDLATSEVLGVLAGGDEAAARSLARARDGGQQLSQLPALRQRAEGMLDGGQSRYYRVEVQAGADAMVQARLTAILETGHRSGLPRVVSWRWRGVELGLRAAEAGDED